MTLPAEFEKRGEVGFRVDYAKFLVRCEWDFAATMTAIFEHAVHAYRTAKHCEGGHKTKALGPSTEGLRLYSLEMWGELAEAVHLLSWDMWGEWVERIDLRSEIDMHDEGREEFYAHLKRNGSSGRNVTQYSSRKRSKEGGRHAGGKGVAVGSHASEWRLSVYQRGDEPGALEFQLKGKRVAKGMDAAAMMRDEQEGQADWRSWQAAFKIMYSNAWFEGQQVTGLTRGDLLAIVAGETLAPQSAEAQLLAAERSIAALPPEYKAQLFQSLQLSLNI